MIDLNNYKLKLNYPCNWCYKIVILDQHNANAIAKNILDTRTHKVTKSKVSSKGKFKSYNIDLIITSDEDRISLHEQFNNHTNIKMVL
jgi:putative lipoic acid-binding regulatory protein